jgi:hypothetical protein
MMLEQEIESYQIIIEACAHNKDDNNGGHGYSKGTNLRHF